MKTKIITILLALCFTISQIPALPVQATTAIKIGDFVRMGRYNGATILWRCVDIDENGPLMLADKILTIKPYDAQDINDTNADRRDHGSDLWETSNIRSWLNSTAFPGNIDWQGTPPTPSLVWSGLNAYETEKGFLADGNFTSSERNAIKSVTQKSLLNFVDRTKKTSGNDIHTVSYPIVSVVQNYDTAYAHNITDKMFLLDAKQLNKVYQNREILGGYYLGRPTQQAVDNSEYKSSLLSASNPYKYWLRTPYAGANYPSLVRFVTNSGSGSVDYDFAYCSMYGVRPAFYLNQSTTTFQSGIGIYSNPYVVSNGITSSSTSTNAPAISSVTLNNSEGSFNLLTQNVNYTKDTSKTGNITANVNWYGNTPKSVLLTQGGTNVIESPNGVFSNIEIGKVFTNGKTIYAIAISQGGTTSSAIAVKLCVTAPVLSGGLSSSSINLLNSTGFTIPEDKPLLGGQSFKFDMGALKIETEWDDSTGKLIVGPLRLHKDYNKLWDREKWKDLKKEWKKLSDGRRNGSFGSTKRQYQEFFQSFQDKGMGELLTPPKMVIKDDVGSDLDVCGYAEFYKDSFGNWRALEGGILINYEFKYQYQGQTIVVAVPVVYELSYGVEADLAITILTDCLDPSKGLEWVLKGDLKIRPVFEAGAGVGVAYIGTVMVKGKVVLELNIKLPEQYLKVMLEGSAKFEIKVLNSITLYEREFAKGTWTIVETGRSPMYNMNLTTESNRIYDKINIHSPVKFEDRTYSKNQSTWLGNKNNSSFDRLQNGLQLSVDYSNKEIRTLQTNVYPDTAPQIESINGNKVMVWITDNTNRTNANKSMLVYSVYDEVNDTWSAPTPIMDNGMADYYPVLKGGYLTFQKAAKVFDDATVSVAEIGQNSEIYIAKWNGTGFDLPAQITSNTVLDTQPQLAVNGDNVSVVWTSNSDNNILGFTGTNSIYKSNYTNGSWSAPVLVKDNLTAITNITAAYQENTLQIAYVPDEDNSLDTIQDRDIYRIDGDTQSRVTENDTIDSNPIFAQNGTMLFWYNGGNIYYKDTDGSTKTVFQAPKQGLSDAFRVTENAAHKKAILWTKAENGGAEIQGALFDGTAWSEDIKISETDKTAKYPNGILEGNGSLLIAFNRTEKVPVDDYYEDGQADLCTIKVMPSYNLSIKNAFVNEENLAPDTQLPIAVEVTNNGELAIEGFDITTTNPDGSPNQTTSYSDILKPGETKEVTAYYNPGSTVTKSSITLNAALKSGYEYNALDNTKTITVGYSDIEVSNVQTFDTLPLSTIKATVANNGYDTAQNVMVSLRHGSPTGEVIASQMIGAINAKTSTEVNFELNPFDLTYESDAKQLYLTASTDNEEVNSSNNYDYSLIQNPNKEQDFDVVVSNVQYDYTAEKTLYLNAIVCNNLPAASKPSIKMEVFDSANQSVGSCIKAVDFSENQTIAVDATIPIESVQSGTAYTVKVSVYDPLAPETVLAQADSTTILQPNYGDVNGDGTITISDVIMAAEMAVGYTNYTVEEIIRANVSSTEHASVDISDVVLLLERAAGGTVPFPVELQ